jgi:hypothetical protein
MPHHPKTDSQSSTGPKRNAKPIADAPVLKPMAKTAGDALPSSSVPSTDGQAAIVFVAGPYNAHMSLFPDERQDEEKARERRTKEKAKVIASFETQAKKKRAEAKEIQAGFLDFFDQLGLSEAERKYAANFAAAILKQTVEFSSELPSGVRPVAIGAAIGAVLRHLEQRGVFRTGDATA